MTAAAKVAFSFGLPVLLTTGSRNLEPYVNEANAKGIRLVARVLSHPSSIEACRKAGISDDNIVSGRGPFSVEENLAIIKRYGIGVLVTKDSGIAGGVPEKLEAAHLAGCRVVLVQRPAEFVCGCKDSMMFRSLSGNFTVCYLLPHLFILPHIKLTRLTG